MANNVLQIKRTTVAGRTPNTTVSTNTQYVNIGELALNLTDFKMFSSNGTVYFEVGANVTSQNAGNGIFGTLTSANVSISSYSNNNYAIFGQSISSYGGFFSSTTGSGSYSFSNSNSGVYGQSNTYHGVYGQSTSGFGGYFTSNSSYGVYGQSNTYIGIYGQSISGYGGYFISNSSFGVYGQSNTGYGVYGQSTSSFGGYFTSTTGAGLYVATSTGAQALYVLSNTTPAIQATSNSNIAVYGQSNTYFGGYFASTTGVGLFTTSALVNTSITTGNSTVNTVINATSFNGTANNTLSLGGTLASGYALLANGLFTGQVNAVSFNVGPTLTINSSVYFSGNSTANSFGNSSAEVIANSTGTVTISPTLISVSNSTAAVSISVVNITGNVSNFGQELGSTSAINTPYIDFHSSGSNIDYDARIIASGGNSTIGSGNMTLYGNVGFGNTAPPTKLHIDGNYAIRPVTIVGSNNIIIYCSNANFFIAASNNSGTTTQIQFLQVPVGVAYSFVLQLSNTTTPIVWINAPKWPSATAPSQSTNTDIYVFFTPDGGTTWRGNQVQKDSR